MTGPTPSVRAIDAADLAPWRELWREYLAFYDTELPDEIYETSFKRLCDPSVTDYQGALALLGATPVGLVHFIYHRHGWHLTPVCYLQDLFTAPTARGHGVGRALIEYVYAAADAAGAASVYWLTQDHNAQARKLYDQVGQVTPFIKYTRTVS